MSETSILILTFLSVLLVSVVLIGIVNRRAAVTRRIRESEDAAAEEIVALPDDMRGMSISEAELLKNYYNVLQSDRDPNSLQNRLIRAGYFSKSAVFTFQIIRIAVTALVFLSIMFGVGSVFPEFPLFQLFIIGLLFSGFAFFLCAIFLERSGNRREIAYRRIFPDFMDTLIVCVDAGATVEAAVDRVSKEFLNSSNKDFGLHLAIMMLEVRGGRRLRDALSNFAKRLRIEEAQSLSVLFRQSEELGASITKTLRVFSNEMREKRMIRAEEKANALPFKMLFPLAGFLFPISLMIVAIPIMIRVIGVLVSLTPGS